jgi:hypothetical protein
VSVPAADGDDDVDHAGFVFEVHEGDAGGGGGALAVGDDAGDSDPGVCRGCAEVFRGQDAVGGELFAEVLDGVLPVVMPVAQRSAMVISSSLMPATVGGGPVEVTLANRSGRSSAARPASQSAWRRLSPKQSKAPAVASAST